MAIQTAYLVLGCWASCMRTITLCFHKANRTYAVLARRSDLRIRPTRMVLSNGFYFVSLFFRMGMISKPKSNTKPKSPQTAQTLRQDETTLQFLFRFDMKSFLTLFLFFLRAFHKQKPSACNILSRHIRVCPHFIPPQCRPIIDAKCIANRS